MRFAAVALVVFSVAVTAGCSGNKRSAPQVFRPFGPAAVEAAALKSGTCLAARTDGDPSRRHTARTPCAKRMPDVIYLMVDFRRCPVQYEARRALLGVLVCNDDAAATAERHAMHGWKGEMDGAVGRTAIRVRNVIVYGGRRTRMRALARSLG